MSCNPDGSNPSALLLDAYNQWPGMVVVKENISTFYYRTDHDAKLAHPPRYPVPAMRYCIDLYPDAVALFNYTSQRSQWLWRIEWKA